MQHELPSEGAVCLGELQEEERGWVERVAAGERLEKGRSPEDLRIPEGISGGPERFREKGARGVPEGEGILPDQHPVGEHELAEEEDGGGRKEEYDAPRRYSLERALRRSRGPDPHHPPPAGRAGSPTGRPARRSP